MNDDPIARASALLHREARALDARDWDAWLDLYTPDAVLWVPAWRDEDTLTADPDRELSQLYHDARRGLEERVARVRSGKSVTTMPLARTAHVVSNVEAAPDADGLHVHAVFQVLVWNPRREVQHSLFGRYQLRLRDTPDGLRIARKHVTLMNDVVPAVLDFYLL